MEGNGCSRYCPPTNPRVSHSLFPKTSTSTCKCGQKSISNTLFRRDGISSQQNESSGHLTNCSTLTKLHITSFSSTESRRDIPANIQPKSTKRICDDRTVSLNQHVSCPRLSSTQGLDVQGRFIPSLLSPKNNRITQALPAACVQRRVIRDDLSPIWSEHRSKNFFHSVELGSSALKRKMEHKNSSLFRRFPASPSERTRVTESCKNYHSNIAVSRLAGQLPKICPLSSKEPSVSGNNVETLGQPQISAKRKDCCPSRKGKTSPQAGKGHVEGCTESCRAFKLCQFCCTTGTAQSSRVVKIHEFTPRSINKSIPSTSSCYQRADLVGSELSPFDSTASPSSRELPSNRCVRSRLGSTNEQCNHVRHLVQRRATAALQSKRDASHNVCSTESSSPAELQLSFDTMRQQDSGCSSPERRRYEVVSPNEDNPPDSESNRPISNILHHPIYTRQIQQSCRSSVTQSPTPGVAPSARLCKDSVCKVGNAHDRSFCLCNSSRSVQLCNSRPKRQTSPVSRRVQCSLELPACMDISTTVSYPKSPNPPESVDRNILNSSPPMGEGFLASRSQSPVACGTSNPEEPEQISNRHVDGAPASSSREHNSRGLEMWGWSAAVKTWNTEQLSLLKNSWRKSTLKTYQVAWKRWLSWTRTKKIDPNNPTGSQLAQFLSDLHLLEKLSYNTILLHKSVVSTLCNSEMSSHLSSHVLVKHILKSIALKQPKTSKPPVWDVSKLTSYLTTYAVDVNNIFQISRHAAMLLLLCSGRRIHDLTLITVDPDHCIRSDDDIVFWPQFGSKTDSFDYRQSGLKFLKNNECQKLDPLYWIEKTITALQQRRDTSKCCNLFMTIRGIPKPASRTVIAGWVKTLFNEAGITGTPGSVRSAVASKCWINNHPLDEILARGNWRSSNTFQRFYRREVMQSRDDSTNVSRLFNPVN